MDIKTVGVVGCGIMGSGITQNCAQSGYNVIVSEVSPELLNKGLKSIDTILSGRVAKGKLPEADWKAAMARIKGTTDFKDYSACDIVIEAVVEDLNTKKDIFARLDQICPQHTILASNTSVLSVSDMAAVTKRPDKVIGTHFSNPVPGMRILEMGKTLGTRGETIETT